MNTNRRKEPTQGRAVRKLRGATIVHAHGCAFLATSRARNAPRLAASQINQWRTGGHGTAARGRTMPTFVRRIADGDYGRTVWGTWLQPLFLFSALLAFFASAATVIALGGWLVRVPA